MGRIKAMAVGGPRKRTTVPRPLEGGILKGCLQVCAALRIMAWRNNTTGVYDPTTKRFRTFTGRKGVSDIIGILPNGRGFVIETKRIGEKPTPEQRAFLDEFEKNGGLAIVATDPGDVFQILSNVLRLECGK